MILITPQILNLRLKHYKNLIANGEYARVTSDIEEDLNSIIKSEYFTDEQVELINDKLGLAQLLCFVEVGNAALDEFKCLRNMLDEIFTRNLLIATRLMKETTCPCYLGTLDDLPDLVKFEINKIICSSF
jgi:hypothetical protein